MLPLQESLTLLKQRERLREDNRHKCIELGTPSSMMTIFRKRDGLPLSHREGTHQDENLLRNHQDPSALNDKHRSQSCARLG